MNTLKVAGAPADFLLNDVTNDQALDISLLLGEPEKLTELHSMVEGSSFLYTHGHAVITRALHRHHEPDVIIDQAVGISILEATNAVVARPGRTYQENDHTISVVNGVFGRVYTALVNNPNLPSAKADEMIDACRTLTRAICATADALPGDIHPSRALQGAALMWAAQVRIDTLIVLEDVE